MARLEIACFTAESATVAQEAGAARIELCANRSVGGVTPEVETLENIKAALAIQKATLEVFVMIRPRGGDFVYSNSEFEAMKRSMCLSADAGADGFVFGILTADGVVDVFRNRELVQLARGRPCTFHRAFDAVPDFDSALEEIIDCGFTNILTAGCTDARGAIIGASAITRLVERAKGRVNIMPGGGIRSDNVRLLGETGAEWYHSSGITAGDLADAAEIRLLRQIIQ